MATYIDPDQDKTNSSKEAVHDDFDRVLTDSEVELYDPYGMNVLDEVLELDRNELFLVNEYDPYYPDELLGKDATDLRDIVRREAAIEDFYGTNVESLDEASARETENGWDDLVTEHG